MLFYLCELFIIYNIIMRLPTFYKNTNNLRYNGPNLI